MRKIKINIWEANDGKGNKVEDSLIKALGVLLANKDPKEMPRGLDNFRLFNRLSKVFDKAEKTKTLELEEADYKFLKDMLEKDIPAMWGANTNIMESIESFINAKEE